MHAANIYIVANVFALPVRVCPRRSPVSEKKKESVSKRYKSKINEPISDITNSQSIYLCLLIIEKTENANTIIMTRL